MSRQAFSRTNNNEKLAEKPKIVGKSKFDAEKIEALDKWRNKDEVKSKDEIFEKRKGISCS